MIMTVSKFLFFRQSRKLRVLCGNAACRKYGGRVTHLLGHLYHPLGLYSCRLSGPRGYCGYLQRVRNFCENSGGKNGSPADGFVPRPARILGRADGGQARSTTLINFGRLFQENSVRRNDLPTWPLPGTAGLGVERVSLRRSTTSKKFLRENNWKILARKNDSQHGGALLLLACRWPLLTWHSWVEL
jgi:hypothetical protein